MRIPIHVDGDPHPTVNYVWFEGSLNDDDDFPWAALSVFWLKPCRVSMLDAPSRAARHASGIVHPAGRCSLVRTRRDVHLRATGRFARPPVHVRATGRFARGGWCHPCANSGKKCRWAVHVACWLQVLGPWSECASTGTAIVGRCAQWATCCRVKRGELQVR